MKNKIYFIEKTIPFNANDSDSPKIAGSEKTLINISSELAKNDNLIIKVFNLTYKNIILNNVEWININNIKSDDIPNSLISMSDSNLLSLIECKKKFLWSHSVQPIEKFIRKKQLLSFIKNKPIMILEGEYHYNTRSFFTSFFGKKIIKIAVDYKFIDTHIDEKIIPQKKAIFTTRSDRNLDFLINCWKEIKKNSNNSFLYINPPYDLSKKDKNLNIILRQKGTTNDLIKDLNSSKVMLNPGHKGEVFCLAAEEARELCIPIVTMGYGSLYERVENGITGYIAKNQKEFIDYSSKILNDDYLYLKMKKNLILKRNSRSYKNVAEELLKLLNES